MSVEVTTADMAVDADDDEQDDNDERRLTVLDLFHRSA